MWPFWHFPKLSIQDIWKARSAVVHSGLACRGTRVQAAPRKGGGWWGEMPWWDQTARRRRQCQPERINSLIQWKATAYLHIRLYRSLLWQLGEQPLLNNRGLAGRRSQDRSPPPLAHVEGDVQDLKSLGTAAASLSRQYWPQWTVRLIQ